MEKLKDNQKASLLKQPGDPGKYSVGYTSITSTWSQYRKATYSISLYRFYQAVVVCRNITGSQAYFQLAKRPDQK